VARASPSNYPRAVLLAVALAAALASAAAEDAPHPAKSDETGSLAAPAMAPPPPADRLSWFALPVVFWLPETRLGLGATAGLNVPHPGAPHSTGIFGAAVATLEKQVAVDGAIEAYSQTGTRLTARARFVHFPDVFYGIGPDTPKSAREPFTRRGAELVSSMQLPVPGLPALRIGPRVDLRTEVIEATTGGPVGAGTVAGADGFKAIALGGTATFDTRDSTLWPTHGSFVEAWYTYAPASLGRSAGFGRAVLDARRFYPLANGRVLGLQGYTEASHGPTPFTLLPNIGSNGFLRGIREGRYRDRLDWVGQAELRTPLVGRLSGTAFAAIGNVAPHLSALTPQAPKVAGGLGLRWRLTDAGANIRVDGAISTVGPELYVLVLEAF
jgi:hypothetical protein